MTAVGMAETARRASELFQQILLFPCLICKFDPDGVLYRLFGVMLHFPIRISDSPENRNTPHHLRAMLVYLEFGPEPCRLPPFSSRPCSSRSLASQTGSGDGAASRWLLSLALLLGWCSGLSDREVHSSPW